LLSDLHSFPTRRSSDLKKFLEHHGVTDQTSDKATVLATWTFAGIAVGLVFAVVGAFVLGPWAFYRTLRGHDVDVSDGAAIWWGLDRKSTRLNSSHVKIS